VTFVGLFRFQNPDWRLDKSQTDRRKLEDLHPDLGGRKTAELETAAALKTRYAIKEWQSKCGPTLGHFGQHEFAFTLSYRQIIPLLKAFGAVIEVKYLLAMQKFRPRQPM